MITQNDGPFYDDLADARVLSEVRSALRSGTTLKGIARQLGGDESQLRSALGEPHWRYEPTDSTER